MSSGDVTTQCIFSAPGLFAILCLMLAWRARLWTDLRTPIL
jgi:hypothetical protein